MSHEENKSGRIICRSLQYEWLKEGKVIDGVAYPAGSYKLHLKVPSDDTNVSRTSFVTTVVPPEFFNVLVRPSEVEDEIMHLKELQAEMKAKRDLAKLPKSLHCNWDYVKEYHKKQGMSALQLNKLEIKYNEYNESYKQLVDYQQAVKRKINKIDRPKLRKDIIELSSQYHTNHEIVAILNSESFGYKIKLATVEKLVNECSLEIQSGRASYDASVGNSHLARKKSRIAVLSELFAAHKKAYFERGQTSKDGGLLLSFLEQLRKELEGDTIKLNPVIDIDLEMVSSELEQREMDSKFAVISYVLLQYCAKKGHNFLNLVEKVKDSYYSRNKDASFPSEQKYKLITEEAHDEED